MEFETRQVFAASRDGTRVPMFIVCRKDIQLDGSNPTLLYGYGGEDPAGAPVEQYRTFLLARGRLIVATLLIATPVKLSQQPGVNITVI